MILSDIPECIKVLNQLELRFVAPRIPFMVILCLGFLGAASKRLGQLGLKGNVVNVPVSVDEMVNILPRQMNQTQTIQIKLMRMMHLKTPYMYENVRPGLIYDAVKYLTKSPLYIRDNITVSENWLDQFDNIDVTRFDPKSEDDLSENDSNDNLPKSQENETVESSSSDSTQLTNNSYETSSTENSNDSYTSALVKTISRKIRKVPDIEKLHATTDTLLDSMNPDDMAKRFAPGENKKPVSLLYDHNCEEFSFPEIYCGREITKLVRPVDRIKSELRMFNGNASRPSKIFFDYKYLQNQRINNQISICLRKKTTAHTASDMLKSDYIENLITTDAGYRFLDNERGSPPYNEKCTKNLKGFVRQCDVPTFFMTFTAAEIKWPPLLISLMNRQKNKIITIDEAENLTYQEKSDLIRNDPVTCARYFDMRTKKIISLLKRKNGVFKSFNVKDYYIRVEFQNRGSPHCHGIFWLENAPKYIKNDQESYDTCVKFIDEFITCKNDLTHKYIASQFHKHTFTCHKNDPKKKFSKSAQTKCRFHFPRCPLPRTYILEPLEDDILNIDVHEQNFSKIMADLKKRLVKRKNIQTKLSERDLNDTFDEFLLKLNLNLEQYILALRSSIKDSTVFLVRNLNGIMINNYNPLLLNLLQSNMDIQFILNIWACVKYIVSYVSKSEKHMSKTLMNCVKSLKQGNNTIRERFRKIANAFLYATETSAQECVYLVLGLHLSYSSRGFIFINTSLPENRQHMLKSKKELENLDPDSHDVFCNDLLYYYTKRPNTEFFQEMCLADFAAEYNIVKSSTSTLQNNDESDNEDGGEYIRDDLRDEVDNENDNNDLNDTIEDEQGETRQKITLPKLIGLKKFLAKRIKPKVIRYAHFSIHQTPSEYFREQCMLFKSWSNEKKELLDNNNEATYHLNQESIEKNKSKYIQLENENILNEIQLQLQQQNDDIDSEEDIENQDDVAQEYSALNTEEPFIDIFETMNIKVNNKIPMAENFQVANRLSSEEFEKLILGYNEKQRKLFYEFMYRLKTSKEPFYIFEDGQAGVGKTQLIRGLVQAINRYYTSIPDHEFDDSLPTVLVCAPTGKACAMLEGCVALTLHTGFSLPITLYSGVMPPLSHDVANSLRVKLKNLKVLMIDEISMVPTVTFGQIDKRCKDIFQNNKPFGGLIVFTSGQFWQLPPMFGTRIFLTDPKDLYAYIVGPVLWRLFEFYELTQIMRQADDIPFALALGKLGRGEKLSIEEFQSFVECETTILIDHTKHLFYTNKEVDAYNERKMSSINTENIISTALDTFMGSAPASTKTFELEKFKTLSLKETCQLPFMLKLQLEIEYICTVNQDVPDSIVNGSTGILKKIAYDSAKKPSLIFFEFNDQTAQKKKAESQQIIKSFKVGPNCVPFSKIKRSVPVNSQNTALSIQREQYSWVPSEALTICKSQGSTYEEVTIGLYRECEYKVTKKEMLKGIKKSTLKMMYLNRSNLYVAASRVKKRSGLKFIGKFKEPNYFPNDYPVSVEYKRLNNDCKMKFKLTFLEDLETDCLKIIVHNIQSLNFHINVVKKDSLYQCADIICLYEAWLYPNFKADIEGFTIFKRINNSDSNRTQGLIIYVKNIFYVNTVTVCSNFFCTGKDYIITECFLVSKTFIIIVYKSPESSHKELLKMIDEVYTKINRNYNINEFDIIISGDFNIDFCNEIRSDSQQLIEEFKKINLKIISPKKISTNQQTQLDVVFSNNSNIKTDYFENVFSYHKVIWIIFGSKTTQEKVKITIISILNLIKF